MPIHTYPQLRPYALTARALGNERRLFIVLRLRKRSYTSIEFVHVLGISPEAVSKHIHVLLRAGLIEGSRKANTVVLSLHPAYEKNIHKVINLLTN